MRALLDNVSVIHYKDEIGIHNRGEAMSNNKTRSVLHDGLHRSNNCLFGAGIDR